MFLHLRESVLLTFAILRLLADALHALTDLVSDIMTLTTISYSLRRATDRFPLGYGKVESLGALGVSGILLSGGLMIGLQVRRRTFRRHHDNR